MKVCVVGGGAAGWISAHYLAHLPQVSGVTLVTSPAIPPIGVGESTTLSFFEYMVQVLRLDNERLIQFLVDIDAAVKYGVSYRDWGPREFLHVFFSPAQQSLLNYQRLGNKPAHCNVNDYTAPAATFAYQNQVARNLAQPHSFHFDANGFIRAMQGLAEHNPKIVKVLGTVVRAEQDPAGPALEAVVLDDGSRIEADYFVSCIGETAFNEQVFDDAYEPYGDILLTDRAVVYPLPYQDQPRQFHPYTVAKTLRHGWRWITPTWSRIGTGYVFSTRHVSTDEATAEFIADIGDPGIEPFTVNFTPRRVRQVFKHNWCTVGMAAGFLEPLDAPGLSITMRHLELLECLLEQRRQVGMQHPDYRTQINWSNREARRTFDSWCAFILCQYKTCHRNDTPFWRDHKQVRFAFYDALMADVLNPAHSLEDLLDLPYEAGMFFNTIAGKDLRWRTPDNTPPKPLDTTLVQTADHYQTMLHMRGFLADRARKRATG